MDFVKSGNGPVRTTVVEDHSIWRRRHEIDKARRDKMSEAMREYDETVHRHAMKALIEECAKIGHAKGRFHNNGFGWCWWYCNNCGSRMEIEDEYGNRFDGP